MGMCVWTAEGRLVTLTSCPVFLQTASAAPSEAGALERRRIALLSDLR